MGHTTLSVSRPCTLRWGGTSQQCCGFLYCCRVLAQSFFTPGPAFLKHFDPSAYDFDLLVKASFSSASCSPVVLKLPNAVTLYNTAPHVVVTTPPNLKCISWLLHNCNFTTAMNDNVNISYAKYLEYVISPKGVVGVMTPQVENCCCSLSVHTCLLWRKLVQPKSHRHGLTLT